MFLRTTKQKLKSGTELQHYQLAESIWDKKKKRSRTNIIYNFGQNMIDESAIQISDAQIQVPGFNKALTFRTDERFKDMLD